MILNIDHVAITAKDFDKSIDFYTKNLGFSITSISEDPKSGVKKAFIGVGQAKVEMFGFGEKTIKGLPPRDEESGIKHIAFLVDNIDEICEKLKKNGVQFVQELITYPGSKFAVFKDPDGIILQLLQPLST